MNDIFDIKSSYIFPWYDFDVNSFDILSSWCHSENCKILQISPSEKIEQETFGLLKSNLIKNTKRNRSRGFD